MNGYMISIQVFGRKIFSDARKAHRKPNVKTSNFGSFSLLALDRLILDEHGCCI